MSDLELLDRLGPAPTPLSDQALARARARLDAAIESPDAASRRPPRLSLLAAAAAVAAGVAVLPAIVSDDGLALAAVDPLTFPLTATWLPVGTDAPVFTRDGDLQLATYDGAGRDRITLVAPESFDHWGELPSDPERFDVAGRDGRGFATQEHQGRPGPVPGYTIVWEQADGDVVGVSGSGAYADPALVERVADSVVDEAQPIDLFLSVAPRGWPLHGFVSGHHVSYGEDGELTVSLLSRAGAIDDTGARDLHAVSVGGRPGRLGRLVDSDGETVGRVLESTAPDGRPFLLDVSGSLSEEQVVEVAAGVRHRVGERRAAPPG